MRNSISAFRSHYTVPPSRLSEGMDSTNQSINKSSNVNYEIKFINSSRQCCAYLTVVNLAVPYCVRKVHMHQKAYS